MAQINTAESRHGELSAFDHELGVIVQWKPFPSITDDDKRRLTSITQAVKRVSELDASIKLNDACNL